MDDNLPVEEPITSSSINLSALNREQKQNLVTQLEQRVFNLTGVNNGSLTRSRLQYVLGHDTRRDLYKECGYLKTSGISISNLHNLYEREAIAARTVEVFPDESWQIAPEIFESEDPTETTAFEKAFLDLDKQLMGESWYDDPEEQSSLVWSILRELDIYTGVGEFGGLLLGINDGRDLSKPIEGIDSFGRIEEGFTPKSERELLYLRPIKHGILKVKAVEDDRRNPRYGLPTSYEIGEELTGKDIEKDRSLREAEHFDVHWTRIVHIRDSGVSRMLPVINRLWDLEKVYAASAEMYWQGAFFGLSIETLPELGTEVEFSSDTNDQLEKYINSLQRIIKLKGATAKPLAPQVVDPSPQLDKYIEAICIALGVPKRIFIGSESGERSSSEEMKVWERKLRSRRNKVITPKIIVPFINRLIMAGVLPKPKSFNVRWKEVDVRTDLEKAEVAVRLSSAYAKYLHSGIARIYHPNDFLIDFGGKDRQEAEGLLERAKDRSDNLLVEDYEGVKEDEGPTAEGKFKNVKKSKPQESPKENKGEESVRKT